MFHIFVSIPSGPLPEIIENELKNRDKDPRGRRYSDAIKRLAITLHYASATAYKILRFFWKTIIVLISYTVFLLSIRRFSSLLRLAIHIANIHYSMTDLRLY